MSKDRTFIAIAYQLAGLSTCDRGHVGALIVRQGRCISWGYNGAPPGLPHCDETNHGWGDESDEVIRTVVGCVNATHAEANALSFAARQGISTDEATLFVTMSPCLTCSRLLIAAGIKRVVWCETYRNTEGTELLERAGVECRVILPSAS